MKQLTKPWRSFYKDMFESLQNVNVVVSYPKSGRTWHRASLGLYIAYVHGLDPRYCLDTRHVTRIAGLPCTSYSHNGANFTHNVSPDHFLSANSRLWRGRNILLLVRDPRAILVSSFHHFSFRSKRFGGSLSEFIRNERTGIEKILVAYNRWHSHIRLCRRFMVQSYEGMHENGRGALCNALNFVGINEIKEDAVDYALELASLENFRLLERDGYFRHKSMKMNAENSAGRKVRQGTTDSYLRDLSAEDLEFIQQAIDRIGNPFETVIKSAEIGNNSSDTIFNPSRKAVNAA